MLQYFRGDLNITYIERIILSLFPRESTGIISEDVVLFRVEATPPVTRGVPEGGNRPSCSIVVCIKRHAFPVTSSAVTFSDISRPLGIHTDSILPGSRARGPLRLLLTPF